MKNRGKIDPDPNNPMNWDNNTLRDWFVSATNKKGII